MNAQIYHIHVHRNVPHLGISRASKLLHDLWLTTSDWRAEGSAARQTSPAIPEPLTQLYENLTLRHHSMPMYSLLTCSKFKENETNYDIKWWTNLIQETI